MKFSNHIAQAIGKINRIRLLMGLDTFVMLLGGGIEQIDRTIRNMVGNVAGMICDGAKTGCAMKVASAVGAGVQSAMLAMDGMGVTRNEGIVEDDIEQCIANLARLGCDGMAQADRVVLDIMVAKS